MVGGGVLAVALGLGGATAGASTAANPPSSSHGHNGKPPSGTGKPATLGKVTALSGGTITIQTRNETTQTVTFTSSTTFRTMSGAAKSTALKVGDFIAVSGTMGSNGSVKATSIMFSTDLRGRPGHGGGGRPGGAPPQHAAASG
jgi:hypothetical protein